MRRKNNKDVVLQALRQRISTQQLLPGERLSEQQFAQEFSVSRALIRDVFTKLEQRGLIKRSPNKSAVVVRLELDEVCAIYAVREMLEGLCARLAAAAPPESWQPLVDFFDEPMEEHVKRGELEEFIKGLQTMGEQMVAAANNPLLTEMLALIHDKVHAIGRRIIVLPGRAEQGLQEHRAVLAALRRGDAEESERLRQVNIRSGLEYLKRYQQFVL